MKEIQDIHLKRIIKQYEDRYKDICLINFPLKMVRLKSNNIKFYADFSNSKVDYTDLIFRISKKKEGYTFRINEYSLNSYLVKKRKFKHNNKFYTDLETCLVVCLNQFFRFIDINEKEYIDNVFEVHPVLRTCTEGEISDY